MPGGDQNALDQITALQLPDEFARFVFLTRYRNKRSAIEGIVFFQSGPQSLGKIAAFIESTRELAIDPVHELTRAPAGFTPPLELILKSFQRLRKN